MHVYSHLVFTDSTRRLRNGRNKYPMRSRFSALRHMNSAKRLKMQNTEHKKPGTKEQPTNT